MKVLNKSTLTFLGCLVMFSCTKSVTSINSQQELASESSDDGYRDCTARWFGIYSAVGYPNDTVKDKEFFANGIATLNSNPLFTGNYFTSIELNIPRCKWVNGDSTRLEVRLRNPSDTIGSVYSYDVSLWLIGSRDSALVTFNAYDAQFTILKVGDKQISNSNDLLYLFQDWTTLALETKNKTVTVYKNGTTVLNLNYKGNKIGKLKQIHIDFKGSGQVDWVKMYNSNTDEQIMQEDFSNRHSNVIWY